ncbi:MAG: hypothetical protein AVDCRST_MAG01-01-1039 [uncultured Rubrobacteraceae bacterium]|uniref:Uncharacterized protein n=1 Tax=uncultured Rubrobacteraceae bacterium TaxID=349277 RepID=A0A6J4NYQ7_9ACTN|nr:MAG: hypothetical protein AVDCRST_MAG01-01-1039 [uncultured Rubrobacteraceae bacterium]
MRETESARRVPFGELTWTEDAPGIRAREVDVGGTRWATVEYEAGAARGEWCEEGHSGFVLAGEYEFDDGGGLLRAAEDEAFFPPPAPPGGGTHRGRTPSERPTRLSLIDDAREG